MEILRFSRKPDRNSPTGNHHLYLILFEKLALTISFPPAIPIIFVSVILLSASIKCYQILCHPKTPTTNNIPIKINNNADQSESLICREEAKNDIRPIQKAAESKTTNPQNNEFKLKQ